LECHAASRHHLLEYCLFPPGRLNLGFITEGKLAAIFIKPSLGVSNWPVIYFINYTPTSFLAPSSPRLEWSMKDVFCSWIKVFGSVSVGVVFFMILAALMLISFSVTSLVPCAYLVARGATVFIARFVPLVVVSA
jgi:hypothetical protein